MENIVEFIPVELIIAFDIEDVPDQYLALVKPHITVKISETRIIHWEWHYQDNYYLLVDITCNPGAEEQGVVCMNDTVIFKNVNRKLTLVNTSICNDRIREFEHVRMFKQDKHDHCQHIGQLIDELETDLLEEEVSEEEFANIMAEPYVHYSSDDASDIESTVSSNSGENSEDINNSEHSDNNEEYENDSISYERY